MARLKSIDIAGWKSIRKTETPIELGPLNVLIGANGAGKSNFISFFKLLNGMAEEHLQLHIARSGGADTVLYLGMKHTQSIDTELILHIGEEDWRYAFRLAVAAPVSLFIAEESVVKLSTLDLTEPEVRWIAPSPNPESSLQGNLMVPVVPLSELEVAISEVGFFLQCCRIYHFHDTSLSAKIRLNSYIGANSHLYHDGGNLASVLYLCREEHPTTYRRIVSTVRKVMPVFDTFVLEPQALNPNNILLYWRQKGSDYILGPHQISDGSLRAMALITLLLNHDYFPDAIILDEPELGLHPYAVEIIAGLIRSASLKTQVIVATQSPALLDHFEPEEIVVVDGLDGESKFSRLSSGDLGDWLKRYSIGELWEKNVVGGGPLR